MSTIQQVGFQTSTSTGTREQKSVGQNLADIIIKSVETATQVSKLDMAEREKERVIREREKAEVRRQKAEARSEP